MLGDGELSEASSTKWAKFEEAHVESSDFKGRSGYWRSNYGLVQNKQKHILSSGNPIRTQQLMPSMELCLQTLVLGEWANPRIHHGCQNFLISFWVFERSMLFWTQSPAKIAVFLNLWRRETKVDERKLLGCNYKRWFFMSTLVSSWIESGDISSQKSLRYDRESNLVTSYLGKYGVGCNDTLKGKGYFSVWLTWEQQN